MKKEIDEEDRTDNEDAKIKNVRQSLTMTVAGYGVEIVHIR